MGGRGASSGDQMNVPYDKWGKEIHNEIIYDKDGVAVGSINDEFRYDMEEDIRKTTKKEILDEVDGWKNDDGTYGTGDEAIYVFYDTGKMVNVTELDEGQKFPKKGIIGVSVSTGDYEMVWGKEYNSRTKQYAPITTWTESGEGGYTNSYSGYKAVAEYKVRVKRESVPDGKRKDGSTIWRRKNTVIRKSEKRKLR